LNLSTASRTHRSPGARRRIALALTLGLGALGTSVGALALTPSAAQASRQQVAIFEDDTQLLSDPAATLQEMRHLGVGMVRLLVRWSWIAPSPSSHTMPRFDATDPNAYPAASWAPLDAVVLDAEADGIQVMFDPTGFAPVWAQGPNPSRYGATYNPEFAWEPSASEYGQFVQAVATRYSGSFVPPGATTPLPRVSYWDIYNEPNFGADLAPQAINGSRLMYSPRMYRGLADAAWAALQATGHGHDTVILGSLLADGYQSRPSRNAPMGLPGTSGDMKPLVFVRELYCLTSRYSRYVGSAAAARGCPTTKAGYASFRSKHPVLFQASAFSDHPYDLPKSLPPTEAASSDRSWAEFSQIPHFAAVLARIQRIYGSSKRFPVWNTEYGYITCPPNCDWHTVSPTTAAAYINWAEYLSWRNPLIASTMQYLLYDPTVPRNGLFASGLVYHDGMPKPVYYAYRMPIFLPSTRVRSGRALEVWGDVRPAPFAIADGDGAQSVQLQFARGTSQSWTTLETLPVADPHGYVDTWVTFPGSGSVRLVWSYPVSDKRLTSNLVTNSNGQITSRTVAVTTTAKGATHKRRGRHRHGGRHGHGTRRGHGKRHRHA
jgi:hypothetical protein